MTVGTVLVGEKKYSFLLLQGLNNGTPEIVGPSLMLSSLHISLRFQRHCSTIVRPPDGSIPIRSPMVKRFIHKFSLIRRVRPVIYVYLSLSMSFAACL